MTSTDRLKKAEEPASTASTPPQWRRRAGGAVPGKSRRGSRTPGTPNALRIPKTTRLSWIATVITNERTKRFGLVARFLQSVCSNYGFD